MHATPSFTFALALGIGVACQLLARHTRVPSIVLLLGAGVALGPDVLGWVVPDALGGGLPSIVSIAVAIILFEGGLNLDMRRLRREALPIRRLVILGALVTMAGAGAVAWEDGAVAREDGAVAVSRSRHPRWSTEVPAAVSGHRSR